MLLDIVVYLLYIYSINTATYNIMKEKQIIFHPRKSIKRAKRSKIINSQWSIKLADNEYTWVTKLERIAIIRKGLPYTSIEEISKRVDLPVKKVLDLLGVPQTTFNKKKREKELLNRRNSEIILVLAELIEYGIQVFNGEVDKFHRWLKKPNISLGGVRPDSFFDSLTGIQIVKNALNKIEYGNFA